MSTAPWLERFAAAVVRRLAQPQAFLVSLGLVVCWAVAGPIFHFNAAWQLGHQYHHHHHHVSNRVPHPPLR